MSAMIHILCVVYAFYSIYKIEDAWQVDAYNPVRHAQEYLLTGMADWVMHEINREYVKGQLDAIF